MGKPGASGITRLIHATRYSIKGLEAAWKNEAAFRQEATALLLIIPLACITGETALERALLMGSWMIVILTELLNSAIEAVVDRVGTEPHELSGRAKDLGSAAVFISLCLCALIWGFIAVGNMF